jgi:pimeloyl-ACP methyl ester carboxylesterase
METGYINVKDKKVPLEVDFSTYLGWILRGGAKYNPIEAMIDSSVIKKSQGLSMLTPYDKNKIPVVFIHGVLSQPRTWVQAINTLLMDTKIRTHYQFWLFAYPTSNPVVVSAWELRKVLKRAKERYNPNNESKYFNHMVLVAHSMGGLVAKQMVIDPGDAYINTLTNGKPLSSFNLDPKEKRFVMDVLKFKPLRFVDTVIFISVPHRGSYMTRWWVASLAAKLVYLPKQVAKDIYSIQKKVLAKTGLLKDDQELKINTGVDNLDPDNKFIKVSSRLPIDPAVKYYSIIGNNRNADVPGGTDGIVTYESAHLGGAQSEIIVKSGHSAHRNPIAIKEIKRILLKHLEEVQKTAEKNRHELKSKKKSAR